MRPNGEKIFNLIMQIGAMESDTSVYTTADGADGRQIIIKLSRWTVTDRLRGAFSQQCARGAREK